jgi:hypothetical protein
VLAKQALLLKTDYKPAVFKTTWFCRKNRCIGQQNRLERPGRNAHKNM